jgi:hypothetical protein
MPYRFAATTVMLLHYAFIAFALVGGLLLLLWPVVIWLHLPVLVWAVAISATGGTCPLTPLENRLRAAGGADTYAGGFIEHYITARFYPDGLPRHVLARMGAGMLALNLAVYAAYGLAH